MRNNRIPARYEEKIMIYDERFAQQIKRFAAMEYNSGQIDEMKVLLNSPYDIDIHHAIIGLRKIITAERQTVEDFLVAQIIPRIMQLVLLEFHPHVQHEAMLILINTASGTRQQVAAFIQLGAISIFSYLIMSYNDKLVDQAAQALSKISEYQSEYRDLVILQGLPLINIRLKECVREKRIFLKTICWTVGTIIRIRPKPCFQVIKETVMILIDILESKNMEEITHELLWLITYGSTEKEVCHRILNSLAIYELLSGIRHRPPSAMLATLIIVKDMIKQNTNNFKIIISKNAFFLDQLVYLMTLNLQTAFLTKIVEILEMISEGDNKNIQSLCNTRQLLMTLYEGVSAEDIQVFKLLNIFRNIINHGSIRSIEQLFQAGKIIDIFSKGDSQYILTSCQCFYQLMLLQFRHHNLGNGIIMQTIQEVFVMKDRVMDDFELILTRQDERIVDIVERIKSLMQRLQLWQ